MKTLKLVGISLLVGVFAALFNMYVPTYFKILFLGVIIGAFSAFLWMFVDEIRTIRILDKQMGRE